MRKDQVCYKQNPQTTCERTSLAQSPGRQKDCVLPLHSQLSVALYKSIQYENEVCWPIHCERIGYIIL